jgi:Holliday junction resolvase RusA-like endonuclease
MQKKEILLVFNHDTLKEYNEYYFNLYPRRKKIPIERPTHPSINTWMIMRRPQMNALKQTWKEFGMWYCKKYRLEGLNIDKCEMTVISYLPTKRRFDIDNTTPKFFLDFLTESKVIIDDDYLHVTSLTLKAGYDKENSRTEIYIKILD